MHRGGGLNLGGGVEGTLRRVALRESLGISAVIVNHVIPLNPLHSLLSGDVQIFRQPSSAANTGSRGT